MASQIAAAVSVALAGHSTGEQRKEAFHFLEQVKSSAQETWPECLRLFLAKDEFGPEARLAALQIVDEAIGNGKCNLDAATLTSIQDGFLDYIHKEFIQGPGEAGNFYLKNKIVRTLFLVFLHTYTTTWPDFFATFIALTRASPAGSPSSSTSSTPLNPASTDLVLRLLHEISIEVSDSALRLNKPYSRISKDTELRDAIRARDAPAIAAAIFDVLAEAQAAVSSSGPEQSALSSQTAESLVALAVKAVGDYVAWIDINLILTPQSLPLLFTALSSPSLTIRATSVEAFIDIVSKGMPSADKLQMFNVLDLPAVVTRLLDLSDHTRSQAGGPEGNDEDEEVYREKLAKLFAVGLGEFVKISDDSDIAEADRQTARASSFQLTPLVLRFLADPVDDVALNVVQPTSALLSVLKKDKKKDGAHHLTPEKRTFLAQLLQVVIQRMQYNADADWFAEDDPNVDPDELQSFDNRRKNLKILFDAVAFIADDVFTDTCQGLLAAVLDAIDANGPTSSGLTWQQVELAPHILYRFGEAAKGGNALSPLSFVHLPPDVKGQARKDASKVDLASYDPSPLGALMLRMVRSKLSQFPHHSAPLEFFECCVRYSEFFAVWPDTIPLVLQAFLDQRGLYQQNRPAQLRAFYLFHKFLMESREQLRKHVSVDMLHQIMSALQPLMTVPTEVTLPEGAAVHEAALEAAVDARGGFDKQLFLFESVGTLTVILSSRPEQQVALLNTVLPPLLDSIRASNSPNIASMDDFVRIVRLHNLILALASTAKGLPQYNPKSGHVPTAPYVDIYKNAATVIVDTLRNVSKIAVIRNAALATFKIVSAAIGPAMLDLIPSFIDTVIGELTPAETVDFLPFISLLTNRFRDAFEPMLDSILGQLFNKVYATLQLPVQGTDDEVRQSELKRAYFNLILSIIMSGYAHIFVSSRNQPQLETVFMSVLHYTTKDSKALDQKLGVSVLNNFALLWLEPVVPEAQPKATPIAGLERFFYDSVLPICFEIPMRKHFDYSDAHSYAALTEMAIFIKTLQIKRQDEFTADLLNRFFPSIGFPPDKTQEFVVQLTNAPDGKAFRKYFNPLMSDLKKALNASSNGLS